MICLTICHMQYRIGHVTIQQVLPIVDVSVLSATVLQLGLGCSSLIALGGVVHGLAQFFGGPYQVLLELVSLAGCGHDRPSKAVVRDRVRESESFAYDLSVSGTGSNMGSVRLVSRFVKNDAVKLTPNCRGTRSSSCSCSTSMSTTMQTPRP